MSLSEFKGQLHDIKQNFHKLSMDERSEAVVLVQKLQDMLLTKDGAKSEKSSTAVHKVSAPSPEDASDSANEGFSRLPEIIQNALPFCKVCSKHFFSWNGYLKHSSRHTCNSCPFCSDKFSRRKDLCHHLKREHKIRISVDNHSCLFCHKSFHKESTFRAHVQKHLRCETNGKKAERTKSSADSLKPPKSKSCSQRLKCPLCVLSFSSLRHLEKHKKVDHGISSNPAKTYSCQVCNETFTKNSLFKAHKRLHATENEKSLHCSKCSKIFPCSDALQNHLKLHDEQEDTDAGETEESTAILCSICGSRFKYKQGLIRHIEQKHSSTPSYKCSYCDFSCRCKTNLKRHVGLHKNDRQFVCELCGLSFNALATLKGHHSYVHSDERKFVCNICSRGFKGRSGLLRHGRIHKDDRPYVCRYCIASYKRMSHLKRHMLSAHKQKVKTNRVQKLAAGENVSRCETAVTHTTRKSQVNKSLALRNESFDENALWGSKLSSEMDETRSVDFSNVCTETPILSTVEIPLTTLEELSLNSIPFNVISSDESVFMVKYEQAKMQANNNTQMECSMTECILNQDNLPLVNCAADESSISDSAMELTGCMSDATEISLITQHIDNLKPDGSTKLALLDSQNSTDSYDLTGIMDISIPSNNLQEDFRKEASSELTNDGCLIDLHVKHSDLTFSSLAKAAFAPELLTRSASGLAQDPGDIPIDNLHALADNTYPILMSPFLAS